jgi:hypothetical protein
LFCFSSYCRSFAAAALLFVPAAEPATVPFLAQFQVFAQVLDLSSGTGQAQLNYQDDFITPGISPCNASLRKHKRQMPNLRKNARGRPHRLQRLCCREENFGFFLSFTRFAVVAMLIPNP